MSILKFELKKEHVILLKSFKWCEMDESMVIKTEVDDSPLSGYDYHDVIGALLFGLPENYSPIDDERIPYTYEQVTEIDKLISELPMALDVILNGGTFEPGLYKTKWVHRDWKKII
jgi:hypothetical protein